MTLQQTAEKWYLYHVTSHFAVMRKRFPNSRKAFFFWYLIGKLSGSVKWCIKSVSAWLKRAVVPNVTKLPQFQINIFYFSLNSLWWITWKSSVAILEMLYVITLWRMVLLYISLYRISEFEPLMCWCSSDWLQSLPQVNRNNSLKPCWFFFLWLFCINFNLTLLFLFNFIQNFKLLSVNC